MDVQANGTDLHVEQTGDGPSLVDVVIESPVPIP